KEFLEMIPNTDIEIILDRTSVSDSMKREIDQWLSQTYTLHDYAIKQKLGQFLSLFKIEQQKFESLVNDIHKFKSHDNVWCFLDQLALNIHRFKEYLFTF